MPILMKKIFLKNMKNVFIGYLSKNLVYLMILKIL